MQMAVTVMHPEETERVRQAGNQAREMIRREPPGHIVDCGGAEHVEQDPDQVVAESGIVCQREDGERKRD